MLVFILFSLLRLKPVFTSGLILYLLQRPLKASSISGILGSKMKLSIDDNRRRERCTSQKRMFLEVGTIFGTLLDERNLKFDASIITTDFEMALLNTTKFWPDTIQLNSYVHFLCCQTRRLQGITLWN